MTDNISWTDRFSKAGAAREAQQVSYEEAKEILDSGMRKQIGDAVEEVFLAEIAKTQEGGSEIAKEIMDVQVKLLTVEKLGSGNILTFDEETREIKPINSKGREETDGSALSEFEEKALLKGRDVTVGRLAKQLQADIDAMEEGQTFRINAAGKAQEVNVDAKDLNVAKLMQNLEKLAEAHPEKAEDLLPERLQELYPEHLGRNEVHGR